ncbi:MAG: TIGR01777 family oxidoreductase [Chloroflexota bacterium]|nr:TIGR01777 family oxidoreductase [Chloroflexota bacterium]
MKIFMTGATGFIGRATVPYLIGKGHSVTAWVRDVDTASNLLGEQVNVLGSGQKSKQLELTENVKTEIASSDCIINLSGKPLAGIRWNKRLKREFENSRIGVTNMLLKALEQTSNSVQLLISSSAVGYYGDRKSESLDDESSLGTGYLSELCRDWESAALKAENSGVRVCLLRLGVVLGREGGMLNQLTIPLQAGISSYLGNGKQYLPWIHLVDVTKTIDLCIENPRLSGAINCVAPFPVTAKQFGHKLQKIANAKITLGIPNFALRVIMGEAKNILVNSQNTVPKKLQEVGYQFNFPTVEEALNHELINQDVTINYSRGIDPRRAEQQTSSKVNKTGQYTLKTQVYLKGGPKEVFSFFISPLNLGLTTPSWLDFKILSMPKNMEAGAIIVYTIKLWIFRLKWTTQIFEWSPEDYFVDFQQKGPYKLWWHRHEISSAGPNLSLMTDTVTYKIPFGFLGRLIHRIIIKSTLIRIFRFRQSVIKMLFQ